MGRSPFSLCRKGSGSAHSKEIEAPSGGGWDGGPITCSPLHVRRRETENVEHRRLPEKHAGVGGGGGQFVYPNVRLEGSPACVCFHRALRWLALGWLVTHLVLTGLSQSSLISKDILQETEPCLPTLKPAKENKTPAQQWRAALRRKSQRGLCGRRVCSGKSEGSCLHTEPPPRGLHA